MAARVRIAVAALLRDGRVLLVHRRASRQAHPDCWDLPGGHVEPGEQPEQAVRRECLEELGVHVHDPVPMPFTVDDEGLDVSAFLVTRWDGEPVDAAPEEHDDLRWCGPADLADLVLAHPSARSSLAAAMAAPSAPEGPSAPSSATPGGGDGVGAPMTIGEFSRATRLSARALRLYHRLGLLQPWRVDPVTGYRTWSTGQLDDARMIRELRSFDMPLEEIRAALGATGVEARTRVVARHLDRMRLEEERVRTAVSGLRAMLLATRRPPVVVRRDVAATPAVVVREVIALADLGAWYDAARLELRDLVDRGVVAPVGPPGGLWATELVVEEQGQAALYVPVADPRAGALPGRARPEVLPAVSLAVATHRGPDATIGQTYRDLGEHVARLGTGADGPVREVYLQEPRGPEGTAVTEIGWPVRAR